MFTVEFVAAKSQQHLPNPIKSRARVYEPSTGAEIRSHTPGNPTRQHMLYELVWQGQSIGFSVRFDLDYSYLTAAQSELPQTMSIMDFGTPPKHHRWFLRLGLDYAPPTFASESEREQAYMKAVEGLLVYGAHGDGLRKPGYYIVRVDSGPNAGLYDLESFGYVTS